ncbi:MAG: hypothetical protein HKP37_06450 [Boseongicola sp.]|nr:hypothetical protein [Boseongicola sp.]NNL18364.1 hypothetical protein [Boseongicola sp.]
MLFEVAVCTETVSIIQAVTFGADGACIDISPVSLLGGVAMFIAAVVALRFMGASIIRRGFPSLRQKADAKDPETEVRSADGLQRMPYESPIRSTGAWGSKPR